MNIFVLDLNTKKCAEYHNSRHNIKMILESVQMLSTACRLLCPATNNLSDESRRTKRRKA